MQSIILRGGMFAVLWWVLTAGDLTSWIVGGPTVIAATTTSFLLNPAPRWQVHLGGVLQFIAFFIWESGRGGVDVAWRALHPRMPLSPTLLEYPLRLPAGPTRVFLANTLSLLPGTLNARLRDGYITVHVLANSPETTIKEIQTLEQYIAHMFNVPLTSTAHGVE